MYAFINVDNYERPLNHPTFILMSEAVRTILLLDVTGGAASLRVSRMLDA